MSETTERPRWLRAIIALTALALLVDALYMYGVKFRHAIHSDAAATVLMASRALHAHAPFFPDWYYGNGEVWVLAPHLFALVPVALLGVSPNALLAASLLGFSCELAALVWAYKRFAGRRDVALLAAALTLAAWSRLHVLFVYIELSYGLSATYYAVLFSLPAALLSLPKDARGSGANGARRLAVLGGLLIFGISLQSPARGLVFTVAPVVLGCAWPWRGLAMRRRLMVAVGALASFGAAFAGYELVVKRVVTFSIPSGHNDFKLNNLAGVSENVQTMGRGVAFLAGEMGALDLLVLPPLLFMVGALVLVARHVFASRDLTALRFACVAVTAQLSAAVLPMIAGNLVVNPWSIRYTMPSLLVIFGLASILAVRELDERATAWRKAAVGWLALVPVVLALALAHVVGSYGLSNAENQWSNQGAHADLAAAVRARGLTHGYATYWNSNLVTLLSKGETMTCPVNFGGDLLPYKWNAKTTCFDRSALPPRFYLATTHDERKAVGIATESLPAPVERFEVDSYFDVAVYETAKTNLDWMDIPVPDGARLMLPFHMRATFPQIRRVKGAIDGDRVVATGEEGIVVFGPYIEVPAGRYFVRWMGSVPETSGGKEQVAFDVLVKNEVTGKPDLVAERTLDASTIPRAPGSELVRLELDFEKPTRDLEARVFSRGGTKVSLEELVLERR